MSMSLLKTWWAMLKASNELAGQPIAEDAIILNFSGSGASCHLTKKQMDDALDQPESKDAELMDFLEAFHSLPVPGYTSSYGDVGTRLVERTSDGWMLDKELDPAQPEYDTLREAIRAAIAASKSDSKPKDKA